MKVTPDTECTLVKQTSRQGNDHCFRWGKNPLQKKVLKNIYRSEQECDQQCQTVQERQCSTVNMQICSTRNEQQCSTGEPISSSSLCFISLFYGR